MVPCLHQDNIDIKTKLRAWRYQKCIPLVGVETPLTCADCQTTPSQRSRYKPENETCVKWVGPIAMVPCLHQDNIYIERKLRVWREQNCILLVGAKTPLNCAGRQTAPSQGSRYRHENVNLRKLGWTCRHGTVLAPRQYLCLKEGTGMERPEIFSISRCKNPSYLYMPSNYPNSRELV